MESWSVGMMVWYVLFGYLVSPRFVALLVCDCSFCFPSESVCLCGCAVSCCRLLPVCCVVSQIRRVLVSVNHAKLAIEALLSADLSPLSYGHLLRM